MKKLLILLLCFPFIGLTLEGHSGKLIFGYVNNVQVVVMQGRFHYYEEATK